MGNSFALTSLTQLLCSAQVFRLSRNWIAALNCCLIWSLSKFRQRRTRSSKRKISWEDELSTLLYRIEDEIDSYLDKEKIMVGFKELLKEYNEGMMNRCTECNVDMGQCNPRQLCGKTRCYNEE